MGPPAPPRPCFAAAHRGLSSEATENTIVAFRKAVDAGFPAVELDLRTTRDGEVVVLHDPAIERTTNGNGRVSEMSYDELRGYHGPDGPVPRLDDLFAALKGWKGLWNLEVKALGATEPALHLVEHHGLEARTIVSSFDPRALTAARDLAPGVARALIVGGPPDLNDIQAAKEAGCSWLNVHKEYLAATVVQELARQGFRLAAWTVNEPDMALALAQRGVECIITDRRSVHEAVREAGMVARA